MFYRLKISLLTTIDYKSISINSSILKSVREPRIRFLKGPSLQILWNLSTRSSYLYENRVVSHQSSDNLHWNYKRKNKCREPSKLICNTVRIIAETLEVEGLDLKLKDFHKTFFFFRLLI